MDTKHLIKEFTKKDVGAVTGVELPVREFVSTGNIALDWAISSKYIGGGLPIGRVCEFFGDPSTGKSVLIQNVLANTQKKGGIAVYDDPEQSYDQFFARMLGINCEELFVLDSETVEEHFKKVEKVVNTIREEDKEVLITIALDSLAMLSTKHEMEVGFEKVDLFKPKLIRQGMRVLGGQFNKQKVLYLVANHVIANIGAMYGPKSTTPGGSGVPFQSSVRVELNYRTKITPEDNKEKKIGVRVRADVVKNKIAPPFRQVIFDIYFDKGVDRYSGLFEILLDQEIIRMEGPGWYKYGDEQHKKRREDYDNPLMLAKIISEVENVKEVGK